MYTAAIRSALFSYATFALHLRCLLSDFIFLTFSSRPVYPWGCLASLALDGVCPVHLRRVHGLRKHLRSRSSGRGVVSNRGGGVEWGSIYTAIGIVSSPLCASDMMLKGNEPRKTSSLVHFHVASASCATTCHFLIISQVFVLRYGRGRENNHVWTSSHCDTAICCGLPYQPSH